MIIFVVLGLVLGLWGSGEAGEIVINRDGLDLNPNIVSQETVRRWSKVHEYETLVTCNESQTKYWTPCEQKMREAMKAMDIWLKRNIVEQAVTKGSYTYGLIKDQWDATYQECVR